MPVYKQPTTIYALIFNRISIRQLRKDIDQLSDDVADVIGVGELIAI